MVVSTSTDDFLGRLVSEVTSFVSSAMLNSTHSLCVTAEFLVQNRKESYQLLMVFVAYSMKQNISTTTEAGLAGHEAVDVSLPRKRLSAFCGDYYNSTSIDVKLGVLGNECFLNGLSFVPNVIFVLVAVPVLISWNKSIFASMHVKTWVRFPHHTIRWLLMFVLIITNLFEVCTITGDTFARICEQVLWVSTSKSRCKMH